MTSTSAFEPDLTEWEAWHPEEVARRLVGVHAPWCVVGGWAIDLFPGGQRRDHGDIEIAVPHARFAEVADALTGCELFVPVAGPDGNGLVWPLAEVSHLLQEHHQTWVREPDAGRWRWRVDIFREPWDGDMWVFRRDERIRRPYREVVTHTEGGIPYLCPEVNLLFKAKWSDLEKNQHDFAAVLPLLEPARRRWLCESLTIVHPDHAWLAELG